MSGHSKWAQIKRKKEVTDKKKGLVFGRISREILSAARAGSDPTTNASLRDATARAREVNMPQATIDRLLTRSANKQMQEITYEAFGPGGAAALIFTVTDNSNRTVQEIRTILKEYGCALGAPGSVRWRFAAGSLAPLHPQAISNADTQRLQELLDKLRGHNDVADVVTDAVE